MPERVARRPVFTLADRMFSWADLVALAQLDGAWADVEKAAHSGIAGLRRAEAENRRPTSDEIAEAATRFRYARNLLAGEQLIEWLEHWQLPPADWRAYVERELVREPSAGGREDAVGELATEDDEVEKAVWAEAVCSGFLNRLAERMAGGGALAVAAGERLDGVGAETVARVRAATARARTDGVTEDAIAHEVAVHRLEWLHVEAVTMSVPLEDTAREAALRVLVDGRSLADVARECGTHASPLSAFAGDLDPELSSALVAAEEGELVGPLRRDDGFALVLVERKTPPTADEPQTRRRAEERIARRAVERAMLEHVEWHERL